jgi:hypothetical protein
VLMFFICCVFCFCYVLLFASKGVCFSFFIVVTTLNIDLTKKLCCLVLVMDGMQTLQYMNRFLTDEKLSF